jgi:hypothetical protein
VVTLDPNPTKTGPRPPVFLFGFLGCVDLNELLAVIETFGRK